ncbi:MAG: hypothetical protein ISP71_08340 [Flavobacteriales bacterium]|nr:hypothetical protein [Flavobacteriales bacterium]
MSKGILYGASCLDANITRKGWGYEKLIQAEPFCIKHLVYNDGGVSSGHLHKEKQETFLVAEGQFILTRKKRTGHDYSITMKKGVYVFIDAMEYHQVSCVKAGYIIEISTGLFPKDNYVLKAGDSQK